MLASTARADLYLFHLTEAMANRSSTQDAGFESLAGVTGAEFVRLTASPQAAISRLLRETAAYYTATVRAGARRTQRPARSASSCTTTRDKVQAALAPVGRDPQGRRQGRRRRRRTCCARRPAYARSAASRARAYTSRMPGSEERQGRRALRRRSTRPAALTAASVGLFDEKNTLKKQWTAQKDDLAKRPVMAAICGAAGHLPRARRRRRRCRPRRHDRLRVEGGSRRARIR